MTTRPTQDQISDAMSRAAEAARKITRHPHRVAEFPRAPDDVKETEDGWFHVGWIGVIGESEDWDVLYDPAMNQGRLRRTH